MSLASLRSMPVPTLPGIYISTSNLARLMQRDQLYGPACFPVESCLRDLLRPLDFRFLSWSYKNGTPSLPDFTNWTISKKKELCGGCEPLNESEWLVIWGPIFPVRMPVSTLGKILTNWSSVATPWVRQHFLACFAARHTAGGPHDYEHQTPSGFPFHSTSGDT